MFKLAPNLTLAATAATDTFAFLGTRGAGKTYLAMKLAELLHDGGSQIVVVDPVGVWWGLRLAADGKRPGLSLPVFGGLHGDLPLEQTSGALCAQLVAEQRLSVVLDVSAFPSDAAWRRFVRDFARELFHLKQRHKSPVHVFFEEAHEFLPQVVDAGSAETVGAVKRLWKLGRNVGIGGSLVSQRAAEVNKGALNLTETLFVGKLKGPQDQKAVAAWAAENDGDVKAIASLPTLKNGQILAWLDGGIREIRCYPKRTFDSSKTPEEGDVAPASSLPALDLASVRKAMAATIEEAKANDPKALRATIEQLKVELGDARESASTGPHARELADLRRQLEAIRREAEVAYQTGVAESERSAEPYITSLKQSLVASARMIANVRKAIGPDSVEDAMPRRASVRELPTTPTPPRTWVPPAHSEARVAPIVGDRKMVGEARRCLAALAQHGPMSAKRLALLAGYAPGGSSFRKGIGQARTMGWVQDTGGNVGVTTAGRGALGDYEPLPTGRALLDYWLANSALPGEARRIMQLLIDDGKAWTQEAIGRATGYVPGGSSMRKGVGRLRSLELVEDGTDGIRLSRDLLERRPS